MQLTTEDKARIFALYLGADCEVISVIPEMKPYIALGVFAVTTPIISMFQDGVLDIKLLLKDLSDITEEDAIEIIKVDWNRIEIPDNVKLLEIKRSPTSIIYEFMGQKSQIHLSYNTLYPFADKLRELGYMLPYKGINLFDVGLAIKQTKL